MTHISSLLLECRLPHYAYKRKQKTFCFFLMCFEHLKLILLKSYDIPRLLSSSEEYPFTAYDKVSKYLDSGTS